MKDEILEEMRRVNKEFAEQNEKMRPIVKQLEHTISNLVGASKTGDYEKIKAYSKGENGQVDVVHSRKRTVFIRNLLYGKGI